MESYIDGILNEKIKKIKEEKNVYDFGTVIKVNDYIIEVTGLDNVTFYERINIENKAYGYVSLIQKSSVIISILKEENKIFVGDRAYLTGEEIKTYISKEAIGRVIDIFGVDLLSNKKFDHLTKLKIESKQIPIIDRTSVNRPLYTGIAGIDLIYPIGKGQRQLIIGDKKTGKTQIALDTIVNQKDKDVICIYTAIGKTKKDIKNIYNELLKRGAMNYTIIIAATNDEKTPVLSLTPYASLSIANMYLKSGFDVLVILDDLSRHAKAYRELSLLSGKTPGRDAYPSDIFYTHSRLLEKGCQHKNGGSITILPIVETKADDITDYISTNIISITDGQIVMSSKNFQKGEKPAINYQLSVSRLGGNVQTDSIKKLGAVVRRELLSYLEVREVYEMANIDDMSPSLRNKMINGEKLLDKLVQYKYSPRSEDEIIKTFSNIENDTKEENINHEDKIENNIEPKEDDKNED